MSIKALFVDISGVLVDNPKACERNLRFFG